MGGNIVPALVERGEAQVYDFSRNEVPGRERARARLLARRRDARRLLRRAHGPHLGRARCSTSTTASGRSSPGPIRCRRPSSSSTTDGRARAWRSTRWSAPASSSPAATVRRSVLSPGVHLHSYAEVEDSRAHAGRRRRPQRRRAPGDRRQERAHRRGRADRRRPRGRPRALHGLGGRRRRHPQGRDGRRREGRAAHARVPARRLRRRRACTSSTSRASCASSIDVDVHAWGADRDAAPIGHEAWDALAGAGAGARRAARDVDRPDDGRGHAERRRSSTATPGTRTSAATWPSSSTTSRTW